MEEVMKRLLTFVAASVAVGAAVAAEPFAIQRYRAPQNYVPGVWEATVKGLAENPGAADDVWFSTGVGTPPLAWHEAQARRMIAAGRDLEQLGITPSLEYQATIGHGDNIVKTRKADISGKTWPGWTLESGTETKSCSCPRQPAFREYVRRMSEIYARTHVKWLWLDDDFRLNWHLPEKPEPTENGCFCATCLADYSKRTGKTWTRAALAAAIKKDASVKADWEAFGYDAFAEVAAIIAKTVHAISPETRFGYQHGYYPTPQQMKVYDALYENGGRRPLGSRPGGGAYTDFYPFDIVDKALVEGRQMDVLGLPNAKISLVCPEIENCPRCAGTKTARGALAESMLALAIGMNSLSYFLVDPENEPQAWYADTYYRPLAAAMPKLKEFVRLSEGTLPGGLKMPRYVGDGPVLWARGLPIVTAPANACGYFLNAGILKELTAKELAEVVQKGAIVDLAGAEVLADNFVTEAKPGRVELFGGRLSILDAGAYNANWGFPFSKLQKLLSEADWVSRGKLPVLLESPVMEILVPRVTADGTLRTLAVVNASIDVAPPAKLRLRGVPTGVKTVRWVPVSGRIAQEPCELSLAREGADALVTLPEIDAWAAGYLVVTGPSGE